MAYAYFVSLGHFCLISFSRLNRLKMNNNTIIPCFTGILLIKQRKEKHILFNIVLFSIIFYDIQDDYILNKQNYRINKHPKAEGL